MFEQDNNISVISNLLQTSGLLVQCPLLSQKVLHIALRDIYKPHIYLLLANLFQYIPY